MGTMHSQIIPSGRARKERARANLANVATGVTLLALGILGWLGTPIGILTLVALVGLGSIMILTDERAEKHPSTIIMS
jgi:hypothetical protein